MSNDTQAKATIKQQLLEQLCQEMAKNQHIMSINDLINAATIGAMWGKNINDPFIGALLSVCLEASRRSGQITLDLIKQLLLKIELDAPLPNANVTSAVSIPRYKH